MWWRRAADQEELRRRRAERANARGLRLSGAGRLEKAVVAFQEAVDLVPTKLEARVNLGSTYYQLAVRRRDERGRGWLEEAARHFEYVLGLDADHPQAALNLAATRNALGDHDEALRLLEGLTRSRPQQRDVFYNLAVAYLQAKRFADARRAAATELERHPDHQLAAALLDHLRTAEG
ncbi:MAG: tetratricopeptide repeat protein [Armatimonadetes bacterium]|nr:tetratricopeptide repeat protein [Armatimonadota bacterium]